MRFDYGSIVPWVRRVDDRWRAVAGPDGLELCTPVRLHGRGQTSAAEFTVAAGERGLVRARVVSVARPASRSRRRDGARRAARRALAQLVGALRVLGRVARAGAAFAAHAGSAHVRADGRHRRRADHVVAGDDRRIAQLGLSLLLGARRDAHARGAAHRRLPERGAALARVAPARGRRRSRRRCRRCTASPASAGSPSSSSTGCPGYDGSSPVRTGNGAHEQLQLDVYGELARRAVAGARAPARRRVRTRGRWRGCCSTSLEDRWREPDEGIWEVRGPRRHFTHSKVLCWVAFDRAIAMVEQAGYEGPVEQWRAIRDEIHAEVCDAGLRRGARRVHAVLRRRASSTPSVLMIPLVGFLPGDDPRVRVDDRRDPARRSRDDGLVSDGYVCATTDASGRRHRRTRGRLPAVQLLDGRGARAGRAARRGARAVRAAARARERPRACSPRSTTRRRSACSATSRRRSRTSRSSRAAHTLAPERSPMPRRRRDRTPTDPNRGGDRARNLRDVTCGHGVGHERGEGIVRATAAVARARLRRRRAGSRRPACRTSIPTACSRRCMPRAPIAAPGTPGYMWYDMTGGGDASPRSSRPRSPSSTRWSTSSAQQLGFDRAERDRSAASRRAAGSRSRSGCSPRPTAGRACARPACSR